MTPWLPCGRSGRREAEQGRAEEDANEAGAQCRAKRRTVDIPFLDEFGCRHSNGADVIAINHGNERRPDQQLA